MQFTIKELTLIKKWEAELIETEQLIQHHSKKETLDSDGLDTLSLLYERLSMYTLYIETLRKRMQNVSNLKQEEVEKKVTQEPEKSEEPMEIEFEKVD